MKTLRICHHNKLRVEMSEEDIKALASAFNRASKPISHIVRLLELEIVSIDKQLASTASLYDRPRPELYTAALLGERSKLLWLHKLLTETLDDDQSET